MDAFTRMDAYIYSPEGVDETSFLMARLAVCITDVIPLKERKRLLRATLR